jgi:uncharacterized protein YutE (UPF0331/DUF86 family)
VVDAEILRRRIDALLGYLDRLDAFADRDETTFLRDPDTHHLAERYLHLALECCLDVANHLVSAKGFEAPDTYRDAFRILAAHGVLDDELGRRLQGWAGMRNVLVHAYLEIDHARTWRALSTELDDLRRLAAIAADLL